MGAWIHCPVWQTLAWFSLDKEHTLSHWEWLGAQQGTAASECLQLCIRIDFWPLYNTSLENSTLCQKQHVLRFNMLFFACLFCLLFVSFVYEAITRKSFKKPSCHRLLVPQEWSMSSCDFRHSTSIHGFSLYYLLASQVMESWKESYLKRLHT